MFFYREKKKEQQIFNLQHSGYFCSSTYHIILLLDTPAPYPIMLNMGVIYGPDLGLVLQKQPLSRWVPVL